MTGKEYDHLGSIVWNKEGISFYSADSSTGKPIYRLFNRWLTQGTHLFTTSKSEYDHLGSIGWSQEGIAFYGLKWPADFRASIFHSKPGASGSPAFPLSAELLVLISSDANFTSLHIRRTRLFR